MPLQNRVDPFGTIHATPARGTLMGNRGGCFHTEDKQLKRTHWASLQWISCRLEHKGWHREVMSKNRYTELFFLDEATALAAGHRPCHECRYEDAKSFRQALIAARAFSYRPKVRDIDLTNAGEIRAILKGQEERLIADTAALPDGAMFTTGSTAYLKWEGKAHSWSFEGYGPGQNLPETALRLTPHLTCLALEYGYRPSLHPSLEALG